MFGRIIKGVGGFYDVQLIPEKAVYQCKPKGIFRNQQKKPLIGDFVEIEQLDKIQQKGIICKIFPRKNELIRPAVANIEQAVIIFAVAQPAPNFQLLDRFLIRMEKEKITTVVCFHKADLLSKQLDQEFLSIYQKAGYDVICTSIRKDDGLEPLLEKLKNKTTVLAGPSGVGKSSILNTCIPFANRKTGEMSRKIKRGKHTTREVALFCLDANSYLIDTPGFTSFSLEEIEPWQLKQFFKEFAAYEGQCRFQGCTHRKEPDCAVKNAVETEKIARLRYKNYLYLYEELQQKREKGR